MWCSEYTIADFHGVHKSSNWWHRKRLTTIAPFWHRLSRFSIIQWVTFLCYKTVHVRWRLSLYKYGRTLIELIEELVIDYGPWLVINELKLPLTGKMITYEITWNYNKRLTSNTTSVHSISPTYSNIEVANLILQKECCRVWFPKPTFPDLNTTPTLQPYDFLDKNDIRPKYLKNYAKPANNYELFTRPCTASSNILFRADLKCPKSTTNYIIERNTS